MELLVRRGAHAFIRNRATHKLEHVSVTQDSLGPAAPKSALPGPSEQGARRCADVKLITLRGATQEMAPVTAGLVTKENTAQRNVLKEPLVNTAYESAAVPTLGVVITCVVLVTSCVRQA